MLSDQNKYEITCEEDSTAFLISAKKLNVSNGDLKRFNFKNDIPSSTAILIGTFFKILFFDKYF